ncbi:hypothetical protein KIL84_010444, partial [Mauremys mutica]
LIGPLLASMSLRVFLHTEQFQAIHHLRLELQSQPSTTAQVCPGCILSFYPKWVQVKLENKLYIYLCSSLSCIQPHRNNIFMHCIS